MDPLEKFKTDFVRARGAAYQLGEKARRKTAAKAEAKYTSAEADAGAEQFARVWRCVAW